MAIRAFDLIAASIGLIILAPAFILIALVVRLTSPGPALFRQERVGRGGRPFSIFKFRTMRSDAELVGGQLTVGGDPRITPVGAFLRRHKIDELPQLINVVRGEMGLVGPRPEVPRYVAHYDDRQRRVLQVRPGITDPASVAFKNESAMLEAATDPEAAYVNELMPAKLDMNLAYMERRSVWTDLVVVLQTLRRIVFE